MKRLPIGIEDFKELIEKSITMWIKQCLSKMFWRKRWSYIQDRAGLVRH